jgi:hypothetical protein
VSDPALRRMVDLVQRSSYDSILSAYLFSTRPTGTPLLAVIGLLNILGIVTFSWNVHWVAFFVILIASFVPEVLWKRYV